MRNIIFALLVSMLLVMAVACENETVGDATIESDENGFLITPEDLRVAVNQAASQEWQLPEYEVNEIPDHSRQSTSYITPSLMFVVNEYFGEGGGMPVIIIQYRDPEKELSEEDLALMTECFEIVVGLVDPKEDAQEIMDVVMGDETIYESDNLFYIYDSHTTEYFGHFATFMIAVSADPWIETYYHDRDLIIQSEEEWGGNGATTETSN
ncbi:MAG: hypothetical protein Q4C22_06740 [Bacillota bacterium]|nr:hypothetical protein [Bacillota bacterium]